MEYTETIYNGSSTPFESEYSKMGGVPIAFSDLGSSQDARMANQVKDTSKHLNTGLKTVEVAGHSPEVFESMPKDHLKELNRLLKLTGSSATFHAPMVDAVGIVQNKWDETAQKGAERQLWEAVERSHDLNPNGNTVVTMHASTAGLPFPEFYVKEKEGKKDVEKLKSFLFMGPDNTIHQIKQEERFLPQKGGEKEFTVKNELERENDELWGRQLNDLTMYTQRGGDQLEATQETVKLVKAAGYEMKDYAEFYEKEKEAGNLKEWEIKGRHSFLTPDELSRAVSHGGVFIEDSYRNLRKLYDLAYKSAKENHKKADLEKLDSYSAELVKGGYIENFNDIRKDPGKLADFSKLIEKGIKVLNQDIDRPQLLKPLKDFAAEKSAETISNLAVKSWEKFKDSAPIISVENHPAGQGVLTKGTDLKLVVEKARDRFVQEAVDKNLMSKSAAEKQAKKLIGVTWDVGHINMLRKYGYGKEDIIKETEAVAKLVKHVHLSDNFGLEHTELPMGMGNVPLPEIMNRLNKEGFKGKKVVEALSWWQHFSEQGKNHAIIPTLQNISSPIYGMSNAAQWSQAQDVQGGYFAFPMAYLPEKHFSMYGSGFSQLPEELGGQMPGTQSRFSGTPNA